MYLQPIPEKKTGRILLTFAESFRENGKVKHRTVERLGYLDEFTSLYEDPIAHLKAVAKQKTEEKANSHVLLSYTVDSREPLVSGTQNRKNIGYMPLSHLYHALELPRFFANRQRNLKVQYSLNAMFSLLVYSRILSPASKKKTFEGKERFFERTDFSLDDVYRALTYFGHYADALKVFLHKQVQALYGRATDLMFYDVTNYYFEIDEPDELRRKGVSKEHRPNPIVQMGLLMDSQGLPVTYELFSGNTNDCETLMPILQKVRQDYRIGRFIVVADRGLNTSNNTAMAMAKGDGYIYGQSILKASEEMKTFCLKEEGYKVYGDEQNGFKIKSRIQPRVLQITNAEGQKIAVEVDEKQIFFYSDKYAKRAQKMRQEALDKAAKLIASPSGYKSATQYGVAKYIGEVKYDKESGALVEPEQLLFLNEDKIRDEERFDGYYAVVTSELDMDERQVMDHYRGLWKIEESFRITKSELEARPVYVSRKDHINAHFLSCFVALLILRLLQLKTKHVFPAGQLVEAMQHMDGTLLQDNYYVFDYYTPVVEQLGKSFNIDFKRKFLNKKEILQMRKLV